jgi:hypothetical protein
MASTSDGRSTRTTSKKKLTGKPNPLPLFQHQLADRLGPEGEHSPQGKQLQLVAPKADHGVRLGNGGIIQGKRRRPEPADDVARGTLVLGSIWVQEADIGTHSAMFPILGQAARSKPGAGAGFLLHRCS